MRECKIPRLFEIMKERKIKAVELSRAINVSTGNISDWKSGRAKPSADKITEIARYLNVSVEYLLGSAEKTNPPPQDELWEQIRRSYDALPDEKRQEAVSYLKFLETQAQNKDQ